MHAGEVALQASLKQVEDAANEVWKTTAFKAVYWLSTTKDYFTTDDVWRALKRYHPEVHTHEHRAMGAVIRRASKAGFIQRTDRTIKSDRSVAHRRPLTIWASVR